MIGQDAACTSKGSRSTRSSKTWTGRLQGTSLTAAMIIASLVTTERRAKASVRHATKTLFATTDSMEQENASARVAGTEKRVKTSVLLMIIAERT